MLFDPLKNHTDLGAVLEQFYGFNISNFEFLPAGEDGLLYTFTSDSKKYVAKLIGVRRGVQTEAVSLSLKAVDILAKMPDFDFVVAPIATMDSQLFKSFNSYVLAIYPFIEGVSQHQKGITSDDLEKLGTYIGRLHSQEIAPFSGLQSDLFDISEGLRLAKYLQELDSWNENHDLSLASEMLQPWVQIFQEELATYKVLQEKMLSKNSFQVVAHGDLSPGNIIFSNENSIKIIDWEGISLSLLEQDINTFSHSDHLPYFLPAYFEETSFKLDIDAFAFYKYKWELEGIVERIELLKKPDLPIAQREHELEELSDELDGHKWLKVGLESIEKEIKKY